MTITCYGLGELPFHLSSGRNVFTRDSEIQNTLLSVLNSTLKRELFLQLYIKMPAIRLNGDPDPADGPH